MDPDTVPVTHPERVLFPPGPGRPVGLTKRDVVDYYRAVAAPLLAELKGRPVVFERFPAGIDGIRLVTHDAPKGTPDWVRRADVTAANGKDLSIVLCEDEATLVWMANLAVITPHAWMSRVGDLDRPDFLLIDLDPGEKADLATLATVALLVKEKLDALGLPSRAKTSGGSGIHVVVPLTPELAYADARALAEVVAIDVCAKDPARATIERTLAKRDDRAVYVDFLQVGRGKTVPPPLALRAKPTAPVSTPIGWDEVTAWSGSKDGSPEGACAAFTMSVVRERIAEGKGGWIRAGEALPSIRAIFETATEGRATTPHAPVRAPRKAPAKKAAAPKKPKTK